MSIPRFFTYFNNFNDGKRSIKIGIIIIIILIYSIMPFMEMFYLNKNYIIIELKENLTDKTCLIKLPETGK